MPSLLPSEPSSQANQPRTAGRAALTALGVALVYALMSGLSLVLAAPSGYASPLYPPAGWALAAALVYGRPAWWGVWVGAALANVGLAVFANEMAVSRLLAAAAVGVGAALQAAVGATLVQRAVAPPIVLNAPRDILRFGIWGAGVACFISPTWGTAVLLVSGAVPAAQGLSNWLTWWIGDIIGVLIAAPMALTFIGKPRADWQPRQRTVALPLLMALGLLAAGAVYFSRLDQQRLLADFQRDADRLASDAQLRLSVSPYALQALHSSGRSHGELDEPHLAEASRWWLAQPHPPLALGYSQSVDANSVVVRHVQTAPGSAAAVGGNELATPATRVAIAQARDSGQPVASAGGLLATAEGSQIGITLYQALYDGLPGDESSRRAQFRGVVFVRMLPERDLAGLVQPGQRHLRWCLLDGAPGADIGRLAGPQGCERKPTDGVAFEARRMLDLGGRLVELRVGTQPGALPGQQSDAAWMLALMGLGASALLAALLLTITGHSRRTQLAVQLGTTALRREMTERTQAEEGLRESEARLRTILDNVPLGVLFLDPQGYIIECNPRLCQMVGQSAEQLRGRPASDLVHDDDMVQVRNLRRSLLKAPSRSLIWQLRMRDLGSAPCHVRMSASALTDPDGRVVRMVGVLEDITHQLSLADANRQRELAQAESRAKSEFVSRMSHELRTPLNAMIGFAQLLGLDQDPGLVAHQREWVQQIQRAGWHLLELINETLDLARIESGHVQLTLQPVALAPLVKNCLEMQQANAERLGVRLHDVLQDPGLAIIADSGRFTQVLSNLLSNAVKYNHAEGQVTLTAQRVPRVGDGTATDPSAELVEITVADTGMGMTEAQLAALFQPYNRLGRETSDIEGTGIGLVICRRLCALMHATLDVQSRAGEGTVFTLRIPAAAATQAPAARLVETAPAPYRTRRVHYIEDNLVNIEVMRGIMLQRPQIEFETSVLGEEGLAHITARPPDLLLLDMQLPDISGLDVLRRMKQDRALAHVPVVVVSADATSTHIQDALDEGALHYVTKPVEVAPFLQTIDNILDSGQTQW
jgi:PAS domain S-box-containing protein